jgi:hypothetical protein
MDTLELWIAAPPPPEPAERTEEERLQSEAAWTEPGWMDADGGFRRLRWVLLLGVEPDAEAED